MLEATPAVPAAHAGIALAPSLFALDTGVAPLRGPHFPVLVPDGLAFHELHTPDQFAQVSHLRSEIQLPEAVRGDPGFAAREKKEMSRVSWVLSHWADAS